MRIADSSKVVHLGLALSACTLWKRGGHQVEIEARVQESPTLPLER